MPVGSTQEGSVPSAWRCRTLRQIELTEAATTAVVISGRSLKSQPLHTLLPTPTGLPWWEEAAQGITAAALHSVPCHPQALKMRKAPGSSTPGPLSVPVKSLHEYPKSFVDVFFFCPPFLSKASFCLIERWRWTIRCGYVYVYILSIP